MKKKILFTSYVIVTLIGTFLIVSVLFFYTARSESVKEFNTEYTKNFKVDIWSKKIGDGMSRKEARALLGEPFSTDKLTRCDFYTKPKIAWLTFIEYKICYDDKETFFLKLRFEYQKSYLFIEEIF